MLSRRLGARVVVAVVLACTVDPATASDAPDAPGQPHEKRRTAGTDVVRLDFDEVTGPDGVPVDEITVTGAADVTAVVARRNGGEILAATSRPGQGRAVRLPAFSSWSESPRAVVRVSNDGDGDMLSPHKQNFRFGADFVLDAVSSVPGTTDDGDNLVQRGRYDDSDQYKLQVDDRRPACRLKGQAQGAPADLEVRSSVRVDSAHWYGADCVRKGRTVKVVVTQFNLDGSSNRTVNKKRGDSVINVVMMAESVPLSVGGKLNPNGSVAADTDQFNGLVDNAYLTVG